YQRRSRTRPAAEQADRRQPRDVNDAQGPRAQPRRAARHRRRARSDRHVGGAATLDGTLVPARVASYARERAGIIIGAMRRNPSTVVVLAGQASEGLLAAVGRSMNVSLVRPEDAASELEAAADALRRAAGISSPYVLVAADPLAAVAAAWRAMWE